MAKTKVSATEVAVQENAAMSEDMAKAHVAAENTPVANILYSRDDVLAKIAETVAETNGVYKTAVLYTVLALHRGATSNLISETVEAAGVPGSYARRITSDAKRFDKFVMSVDHPTFIKTCAEWSLDEVFNALNTIFNAWFGNKPIRVLGETLSALDPEAIARKAKKEAEAAAKAEALIEENDAKILAAGAGPDEVPGFTIEGATLIDAMIGALDRLSAEERDALSAAIYALQNPAQEQEPEQAPLAAAG